MSEYWAWVRYLNAISGERYLSLTEPFAELDPHQKTILSDDFGMGVPMYWLVEQLQLGPVCDGKYFIQRVAASVGANAVETAKLGANKSPDFVARDINGDWHVVECKGTQSGGAYRKKQFGKVGPPPTGAIAQKQTITFPSGNSGQRLACGLTIGLQGGRFPTELKIIDPDEDFRFTVNQGQLQQAEDAAVRGSAAKGLRLAGFGATASVMSAPWGRLPSSSPTTGRPEALRRREMDIKNQRATAELEARQERRTYGEGADRMRGREVRLDLSAPITVNDRRIRAVWLRQGVSEGILGRLAERLPEDDPSQSEDVPWRASVSRTIVQSDEWNAILRIGSLYKSEIELMIGD